MNNPSRSRAQSEIQNTTTTQKRSKSILNHLAERERIFTIEALSKKGLNYRPIVSCHPKLLKPFKKISDGRKDIWHNSKLISPRPVVESKRANSFLHPHQRDHQRRRDPSCKRMLASKLPNWPIYSRWNKTKSNLVKKAGLATTTQFTWMMTKQ